MLARLHERALEKLSTGLSLAQEQSGDTRAKKNQRVGAVLGKLPEERDALVQVSRTVIAMAGQDRKGAVGDMREHSGVRRVIRSEQLERAARRRQHLLRSAGAEGRDGRVSEDSDCLQPVARLDSLGGRNQRRVTLQHRAAAHRDVASEGVDRHLQTFSSELASSLQRFLCILGPAAEPGVVSRLEEPRRARRVVSCESCRLEPGGGRCGVTRALVGAAGSCFEGVSRLRVVVGGCCGQVPGPAVSIIGSGHGATERSMGGTALRRRGRVINGRACQRMDELDAAGALADQ